MAKTFLDKTGLITVVNWIKSTYQKVLVSGTNIKKIGTQDVIGSGSLQVDAGGLADDAVTTDKIADDAVTASKIADRAVTSDKVDWATIAGEINFSGVEIPLPRSYYGRRCYAKVINVGTVGGGSTKTVAHGISDLSQVIRASGYGDVSGSSTLLLPDSSTSILADSANVSVSSARSTSLSSVHLEMIYTKTT